MIKPEELRIGNFLQDRDGKLCQVTEIYANGKFYAPVIGNAITKLPNSLILITDEWLNDFGFYLKEGGWEIIIKNETCFSACKINGGYSIGLAGPWGLFTVKIKYIHELQNLFFIISGNNELKLKKSKENKSENSASFLFPD